MDQPGVEVRPIVNAVGSHDFNEVFFSDARTPRQCVIGEPNEGWRVTNQLLMFERGGDATTVPLVMRSLLDRLVEVARDTGQSTDPMVRQTLAGLESRAEILRYSGMRTLTAVLSGGAPGPESSINKVMWSELYQDITVAAVDLLGGVPRLTTGRPATCPYPPTPPATTRPPPGSITSCAPAPPASTRAPTRSSATSSARGFGARHGTPRR